MYCTVGAITIVMIIDLCCTESIIPSILASYTRAQWSRRKIYEKISLGETILDGFALNSDHGAVKRASMIHVISRTRYRSSDHVGREERFWLWEASLNFSSLSPSPFTDRDLSPKAAKMGFTGFNKDYN